MLIVRIPRDQFSSKHPRDILASILAMMSATIVRVGEDVTRMLRGCNGETAVVECRLMRPPIDVLLHCLSIYHCVYKQTNER